jgi:transcriptional regulator of acetoin/glycerol metabolism
LQAPRPADAPAGPALTLDEAERQHVARVLQQEGWAVQRAADVLGISRTSLYERIRKFGLARPEPDGPGPPT